MAGIPAKEFVVLVGFQDRYHQYQMDLALVEHIAD
jgi:hypothetical protein